VTHVIGNFRLVLYGEGWYFLLSVDHLQIPFRNRLHSEVLLLELPLWQRVREAGDAALRVRGKLLPEAVLSGGLNGHMSLKA
jgi:hypothetical protein